MVPQYIIIFDTAAVSSSVPDSVEEGPLLPNERNDLASPTQVVEPSHLAPRWESLRLPVRVANTISEVRALSTRCLYTLKWSLFSDWCAVRNEDPSSCDISSFLPFYKSCRIRGTSHPRLKYMWQPSRQITPSHTLSQQAKTTWLLSS